MPGSMLIAFAMLGQSHSIYDRVPEVVLGRTHVIGWPEDRARGDWLTWDQEGSLERLSKVVINPDHANVELRCLVAEMKLASCRQTARSKAGALKSYHNIIANLRLSSSSSTRNGEYAIVLISFASLGCDPLSGCVVTPPPPPPPPPQTLDDQ